MSGLPKSEAVSLEADEVHLWCVEPGEPPAGEHEQLAPPDAYINLLSPDERARYERFVFDRDRWPFLVAHSLVRTTLSRYVDVAPQDWQFDAGRYGKPEIAQGCIALPLRFNLSHTRGMIVCGVTLEQDLGVDVEHVDRRVPAGRLAERFFAGDEAADLRQLPPDRQLGRFLDYWTLKESYIKARGLGLAIPLGEFSFQLSADSPPRISFAAGIDDDPNLWQFAQLAPGPNHRIAVAVHRLGDRDKRLVLKNVSQPLI